jgi:hypothetical protein
LFFPLFGVASVEAVAKPILFGRGFVFWVPQAFAQPVGNYSFFDRQFVFLLLLVMVP